MALTQVIVGLDILAFCAAVAMTVQAWRSQRVLGSKQSLAFLTCFALITIGLASRMVTDVLADITGQYMGFVTGLPALAITPKLFLLVSALAILSGYTVLLLVVEDVQNVSMWVLVFLLVGLTVFLARDIFLLVHVLAIVLLALLTHRFYTNFTEKNSTGALIVYASFLALLAAHVAALLTPFSAIPHVVFLALRLAGYFGLFAVSWRVAHG